MKILEAYDLTGSLRDAAELAGCSHHTVGRYVAGRECGRAPGRVAARASVIDPFREKLEELVDRSHGKIRADVAHDKITAMGYGGSERTTRRAVAEAKAAWRAGRRRVFRPWVPEPGMWAQYDFGDGPQIGSAATILFCFWLAWSRFRVVLPLLDRSWPSVAGAIDVALRRAGGVPTYLLTDNEKTVTVEHVARLPVRNPAAVVFGRHYGLSIATCVPYDPASKGGSESTVKVAKADGGHPVAQQLHRVPERHALRPHHPVDHTAAGLAGAQAVPQVPRRADHQRRRAVRVERAAPGQVRPGRAQRHPGRLRQRDQ